MDNVITLVGVGKTMGGETLLRDVSFDVRYGEAVGLIGPSGSGKTTILRLIAGFESPSSGDIFLNGRVVSDRQGSLPPYQRGIGMVPQRPSLWPHMTVAQNVSFGLQALPKREREQRLDAVLETTNLSGFERRLPHQLSGGEAQRVALARAIAPQPRILLLDEPLSALDPDLHAAMLELFWMVRMRTRSSMLYVSHDHDEAKSITDRVVVLRRGAVEHDGGWESDRQAIAPCLPNSSISAKRAPNC